MRQDEKYRCQYDVICGPLRVLSGQILIRPFIKRIRDDECRGSSKARLLKQHFPAAMRQPAYTNEQLISVTTGEIHQLPCDLTLSPRATTPARSECARRTRVYMRSRETNAGKTIGAIGDNASRLDHIERVHTYTCMAIATHPWLDDGRDK